jgi:hypothetical protein
MCLAPAAVAPPPLSDEEVWQTIIADKSIGNFTPEQILEVYDEGLASCSMAVREHVADYVADCINARLRKRFGRDDETSFDGECKEKALSLVLEAFVFPESARYRPLRLFFHKTISYIIADAIRIVARNYRRFPRHANISERYEVQDDVAEEDDVTDEASSKVSGADRESELIRQIDRAESLRLLRSAFLAIKHLESVFQLTLDGKTQDEIADDIGLGVRQIRRLQEKIIQILSEPDTE